MDNYNLLFLPNKSFEAKYKITKDELLETYPMDQKKKEL